MRSGSLVLLVLLLPALTFAAIVPVTEQPVSAPTYGEAIGTQGFPVSASAGNDLLVAWTDVGQRAGIWDTVATAPSTLTPNPARKVWSGNAAFLQVCWTGSTYLLIWQADQQKILTASLDRSGALITQPQVVVPGGAFQALQSMTWDGHRALLVATGNSVTTFLIFDASGNLVSGPTQLIAKYSSTAATVAIGDTFTIFYVPQGSLAILATRVRDNGEILDATPHFVIEPQNTTYLPFGAATDGHRIALAYGDAQFGSYSLRRAFVDPSTLAAQPLQTYPTGSLRDVALVWNGAEYVASWFQDGPAGNNLMTLAYRDTETPSPTIAATVPGIGTFLNPVWTGRDLWFTFDAGRGDVDAQLADLNGAPVGNPFPVSTAAAAQIVAALAPGFDVWGEAAQDGQAIELFGAPALISGATTRTPVRISTSGNVVPSMPIKVLKSGLVNFVVWNEFTSSSFTGMMRRVRADGTPIDPQPVALAGTAYDLAASGTTVVIPVHTSTGLMLARFDTNGNPLDSITLPFDGASPRIASNGDEFLLVWNEGSDWWQFPSTNALDVFGARLDATGQPIDTTKFAIAATKADEMLSTVASNGHDFIVAYTPPSPNSGGAGQDLVLQRVDANGTIDGAPQTVATRITRNTLAIDAADNGGYWVAYSGGTYDAPLLWVAKTDASGARLDSGVIAAAAPADLPFPNAYAIVGLGNAALVSYSRFDTNLQVPRVFTAPVVRRLRTHAAGR